MTRSLFIPGLTEFAGRTSLEDPLKVYRFRIDVAGFTRAGCTEVTGFGEWEADVVEYREGGDNATIKKSPGIIKIQPIVIKRGLIVGGRGGSDDFVTWASRVWSATAGGAPADFRRQVTISLLTPQLRVARKLRYLECWPSRFKAGADLSGNTSENHIEELTLQNEGFVVEAVPPA